MSQIRKYQNEGIAKYVFCDHCGRNVNVLDCGSTNHPWRIYQEDACPFCGEDIFVRGAFYKPRKTWGTRKPRQSAMATPEAPVKYIQWDEPGDGPRAMRPVIPAPADAPTTPGSPLQATIEVEPI